MVCGYPAHKNGVPHFMIGKITGYKYLGFFNSRCLIYYEDLDTSVGQSGGALLVWLDGQWWQIGVHVHYDKTYKANVATGITENMEEWIQKQLEVHEVYKSEPLKYL